MPKLNSSQTFLLFAVAFACQTFTGCGKKNPVEMVSADQSGVVVRDVASASESDWNGWRGPRHDGVAVEQPIVTQWDEETNIRWKADVPGRGHSSPIVVGDAVFLATADENSETQSILCFDRTDGSKKWEKVIHQGGFPSPGEIHKKATNANGTIASDGERLYIGMFNSDSIIATALSLDGQILWQEPVGKFVSKFGYAPSPILYKSLVILAADNRGGGYLVALDGESGKIAWRVPRGDKSSYSSPMVANVGGRDQILISGNDAVASYDPTTGEELWQTECVAEATCGTVVVANDRIFASGGYPQNETVCLTPKGELVWSVSDDVYEPSMLAIGDYLLAVDDAGIARCWSAASGDELWKKRLGGNFSASPVMVGETILVPNLDGKTFVFRAGEKYESISTNRLGDDCYASPAVSNGDLFLRIGRGQGRDRSEQLVCIGGEESLN